LPKIIEYVEKTLKQYDEIAERCKEVFMKKAHDYGSSWRILRPSSLTDQLFIKAKRIRSIEENETQKVDDSVDGDYTGIVNYGIIALIQLEWPPAETQNATLQDIEPLYDKQVQIARNLMAAKNHDYGEAWRDMRTSSMTDLILMKILRLRQIEDNDGKTLISEGRDANYLDIVNYAIFALILLSEEGEEKQLTP
jgi:Nucleotide modification associated domain 1